MIKARSRKRLLAGILFASTTIPFTLGADTPDASKYPPIVEMTAAADHQRIMDMLDMKTIRSGANGSDRTAPNYANYDESKANPFPTLPDPLVMKNGQKVTTPEMWWSKRRPEIVEDFDREVYGRVPKDMPKVTWEVTSTTEQMMGDTPVITKQLIGHVDNSAY